MESVTNTIQSIANSNKDMMRDQRYAERHMENLEATKAVEDAIVSVAEYLTNFLQAYTGKTEITNPTTVVSTPDIVHVVQSVNDLSETVKASQLDLSPIVEQLGKLEAQLKDIPKELPELPEQKDTIKVSNLAEIDFTSLETAVKAIKLEQPDLKPILISLQAVVKSIGAIHIPETDTKPLEKGIGQVEKAVKAIKLPVTDVSGVEKRLDTSNKLLEKIVKKPVGGGSGGGSSWPAVNESGVTQPLNVNASGELIVAASPAAEIQNVEMINALRALLQQIAVPSWFDPTTNTLRVGTTAVTVSSGTVTTVGTVTNLTNFGTNAADVMARDISINTWANTVRSTIS